MQALLLAASITGALLNPVEEEALPGRLDGVRGSVGYEFIPLFDTEVTALGFVDEAQDGLATDHVIDLWRVELRGGVYQPIPNQPLLSATVMPDAPLDGFYHFADVDPFRLTAGQRYVISSPIKGPEDALTSFEGGLHIDPTVFRFEAFRKAQDASMDFPELPGSSLTLAAPNLQFRLVGDADGDGVVEFSDFVVLARNFGLPGNWSDGDFDHDGMVGLADFAQLANNFPSSATASVPEPATSALLALGLLLWSGCCRRRKSTKTFR